MRKVLVVGGNRDSILIAQRAPFRYYRRALQRQGVATRHVAAESCEEILAACKSEEWDHVFLMPSWRESAATVEQTIRSIRSFAPKRGLFVVDPFAQSSSRFFTVLPEVDALLKRQRYRDTNVYHRTFVGGTMLTDYLVQKWGCDLSDWDVSSPVPEGYEERIRTGWNLGMAKKFRSAIVGPDLLQRSPRKKVDIFCRLSLGSADKKEWYFEYRKAALAALEPLSAKYRAAISGGYVESGLVSRRQYYRELRGSRLVFSPFGWGETCWRDFEAISYDCLLVKPDVSHLDTQPDIFIAGETYAPVKWDFSNLAEVVTFYLDNPDECDRLVANARRVYREYFKSNQFVVQICNSIEEAEQR